MNNWLGGQKLSLWLTLVAGLLLISSLGLPLWQLRMEAPQYRDEEALKVRVYPRALSGDLNEIKVLNRYIGVHIPEKLPQTQWIPWALGAAAALAFGAVFLPAGARRYSLFLVPCVLALALGGAVLQAQWQMYDIGHKRDHKTALVGVKDFSAPLLGTRKIAQFQVTSRFGPGAYLIGMGILLQFGAAWVNRRREVGRSAGLDSEGRPVAWSVQLSPTPPCPAFQERP